MIASGLFLLAALMSAQSDAPIRITINPEARVNVMMAAGVPQPAPCGTPVDLTLLVLNHGFVTAPLEVYWVGEPPAGARLELSPEPLSGAVQELRTLKIYLAKPGPTDVAIAFKARNDAPDLGGRSRVHFLMSCN